MEVRKFAGYGRVSAGVKLDGGKTLTEIADGFNSLKDNANFTAVYVIGRDRAVDSIVGNINKLSDIYKSLDDVLDITADLLYKNVFDDFNKEYEKHEGYTFESLTSHIHDLITNLGKNTENRVFTDSLDETTVFPAVLKGI